MTQVLHDVRFGIRMLKRSPGFTLVAVLTLALGVGSTTAIFSIVHATLLAPLPFTDPEQLVMVWSQSDGQRDQTSVPDFRDWKARATAFQELNAWTGRGASVATDGAPEFVPIAMATPGFITMHGHRFLLGRDFLAEESTSGRDAVVVLTHRFWETRLASDRSILGKIVRIDARPHTVVGVLDEGPADRASSQAFVPLVFGADAEARGSRWLLVMGRLKAGVTIAQANAQLDALERSIAAEHPEANKGLSATVEPLQNNFLSRETTGGLWLALGAVGFVLLIGCANVANLLLARGAARKREVAIRSSLGAPRRRIFAQFLTESLTLSALGGVLGVVLSFALVQVIVAAIPRNTLPSEADVRVNMPVLLFSLFVTTLAGVLAGCAPALQALRATVVEALNESARSLGGDGGRATLRRVLVIGEFALAIVLLSGGGLAVASFGRQMTADPGFETRNVMAAFLPLPNARVPGAELDAFYRRIRDGVNAIPGVSSVSISNGLPGSSNQTAFSIAGTPVGDRAARPSAAFNSVTPSYFETFGLKTVRGRAFTIADSASAPDVALVNEAFVRTYFEGLDPLSQRIVIDRRIPGESAARSVELQVVGVLRDFRRYGLLDDAYPEIDVPFAQHPRASTMLSIRSSVDPDGIRRAVSAAVASVDPDLPTNNLRTMDENLAGFLARDRFRAFLFGGFASIALLLATAGIYGVMSFVVAQRTQEIGLRMALGARRAQVLTQIIREGMTNAASGAALGILGAFALGRVMKGLSYRIDVVDPASLTVVTGLLMLAALLACLAPARRASSVDPMVALRND